jgi:hypothetical protein
MQPTVTIQYRLTWFCYSDIFPANPNIYESFHLNIGITISSGYDWLFRRRNNQSFSLAWTA